MAAYQLKFMDSPQKVWMGYNAYVHHFHPLPSGKELSNSVLHPISNIAVLFMVAVIMLTDGM